MQRIEAHVDRQEIERGNGAMPPGALLRLLSLLSPRPRLPPLPQQLEHAPPVARRMAALSQFGDLGPHPRLKFTPLPLIKPLWEVPNERIAPIGLVKRHRLHPSFSYEAKTWPPPWQIGWAVS
jgi:hypothetical protein